MGLYESELMGRSEHGSRPIGRPAIYVNDSPGTPREAGAQSIHAEFRENPEHLKHGLPCRRGRIETLLMQKEVDAERVKLGQERHKVSNCRLVASRHSASKAGRPLRPLAPLMP